MNSVRIIHAAKDIERLTLALEWFQGYGHLLQHRDKDSFSISIKLLVASACHGAREADVQINAVARVCIDQILSHAIRDAENTIQMCKEILREEITNMDTP